MDKLDRMDHSAIRVHQVVVVVLNLLAYLLDLPWLAALVAVVMLLGAAFGRPGFGFVYAGLLRPLGLVRPAWVQDQPGPHRFAQGLGAAFMLMATLMLFAGWTLAGWGLVWLVALLAGLNAFGGFCAGCFVYYWLGRLGMPGFAARPPAGTMPGFRPPED